MARRSRVGDPEAARRKLVELLEQLPERLKAGTVGEQVCSLVEVNLQLRELGASIGASLAPRDADSGRARLLAYLRHQVGRIVHTEELMIVAGIGDYPRRVRELRADHGWPIISGMAVRDMRAEDQSQPFPAGLELSNMAPEEYLLIEDKIDPGAIRRWNIARAIRERSDDPQSALLAYFQDSPGQRITAEELRFVSGNENGWPAIVRDLALQGHDIRSRPFGALDLPPGIYIYGPV
jgi:hypothetical protein